MEKLLGDIPKIMREEGLVAAVENSGNVIARSLDRAAPIDNSAARRQKKGNKPHLRATHDVKAYRIDAGTVIGIIGALYPDGAQSHLVSEGHKVVPRGAAGESNRGSGRTPLTGDAFVEGDEYMQAGFAASQGPADRAFVKSMQRSAVLASKGKSVS